MPPVDKLIISPRLIGREQELEILSQALQTAARGTGQCILVAGEAGVGKSRLLAEFRAAATNCRVLQGACFEPDAHFPHALFIDALRMMFAPIPAHQLSPLLGHLGPELAKLLPELTLKLPNLHPSPALDSESEKRRFFEVLSQFFFNLAQEEPLLLILDDLHWADEISLELLGYLARRLKGAAALVLGSYRPEDASPPLNTLLVRLRREQLATEVSLAPLDRVGVNALLHAVLNLPRPVGIDFLEALFELTEGNPFFIEEVLKTLLARGINEADTAWKQVSPEAFKLPPSIQQTIEQRLRSLSERGRAILQVAAVAGRRFDFVLLHELTGYTEDELLVLVKEALAAQFIVEEEGDRFSFRHALTRQAIYLSLLARERVALHRQIAETLEAIHISKLEAYAADLAEHNFRAGAWEAALQFAKLAADRSARLFAPRAVVWHLNQAIQAASRIGQEPSPALHLQRGQAYELLGDFDAAQADYEVARRAAYTLADHQAGWEALFRLGFLWTGRDYVRAEAFFRQAEALASRLEARAPLAQTLNGLGNWHMMGGQLEQAVALHEQALAIFEDTDDRHGQASTLDLLGVTNYLAGDMLAGAVCHARAVGLFRQLDERQGLASSLATYAGRGGHYFVEPVVYQPVNLAECHSQGEQALQIARALDWRAGECWAAMLFSLWLGPRGELAAALDYAEQALHIAQAIEHGEFTAAAHIALGALHLELLSAAAARQHFQQALAGGRALRSGYLLQVAAGYLASACVSQGDETAAHTALAEVLDLDAGRPAQARRRAWQARAELALLQGDAETCLAILGQLIALAPHAETYGEYALPRLSLLQAQALMALERTRQAETVLVGGLDAARRQGLLPLVWRFYAALGEVYLATRNKEKAYNSLESARDEAGRLAARLPSDAARHAFRLAAEKVIASLPELTARQQARRRYGGLTARQREVARLIAQGKSNQQIAEALVLSPRTVEVHVSNILAVLGFTNRAQIAAWAVEEGLTATD